jgi:CBS domain-containing protein
MITHARRQVSEFMSPHPATVNSSNTIHEAFAIMEELSLRHLPVIDDDGLPIGVITDRDIAFALGEFPGKLVTVDQAMTPEPYTVPADGEINEVLKVMANNKLGCALVKDQEEKLVGIFTTTDAVRLLSELLYPN